MSTLEEFCISKSNQTGLKMDKKSNLINIPLLTLGLSEEQGWALFVSHVGEKTTMIKYSLIDL